MKKNKINNKKMNKKTLIFHIIFGVLISLGVFVTINVTSKKAVIKTVSFNLSEGDFEENKVLEDYYRLTQGKLPKYAKFNKKETIKMYSKDDFTLDGIKKHAYFAGKNYSIETTFIYEGGCFPTKPKAIANFKDSNGNIISGVSGGIEYFGKSYDLASKYEEDPKIKKLKTTSLRNW